MSTKIKITPFDDLKTVDAQGKGTKPSPNFSGNKPLPGMKWSNRNIYD